MSWSRALGIAMTWGLLACSQPPAAPTGELAPHFDLERLGGGRVTLEELRGKIVLIDFWATWCPPCVLEIPELNAFYEEHRGDGVELLSISIDDEDREELERWAREHDIRYPVVLGDTGVAHDYGAYQFPFHLLIGPDGRVLERLTAGFHDREELTALLRRNQPG